MRTRVKTYIFLVLILFSLGLVLISPSVNAKEYQLGFADKTRLTLIYEYTEVDSDKLEDLADSTEDDFYNDLGKLNKGDKFKLVVSDINELENYWLLSVELYKGKSLDERDDDFESRIFKKPKDLASKILKSDTEDKSSFFFLPVETEGYLKKVEEHILEDDKYLEEDYEFIVDNTKLIFDYVPSGYLDTFLQEYNDDGTLNLFEILCNYKTVFKIELVDSYEDYNIIIYSTIIIIVSVIAVLSISTLLVKKKKKEEPLDPKIKVNNILDKVR